ncbi:MAG TPA: hypothetical protein VEB19_18945 [Gemmatimonadaceae bacterium]|nr:hypothetical protein [Gemmatimonadaceae bacterium]
MGRHTAFLVVSDSGSRDAQLLASALGARTRAIGATSAVPLPDEVAVRAAVTISSVDSAVVQVDLWGVASARATNARLETTPYFSRYLVVLRRDGGSWKVVRTIEVMTS